MKRSTRRNARTRLKLAQRELERAEEDVQVALVRVMRKRMVVMRWELAVEHPDWSWKKIEEDKAFRQAIDDYAEARAALSEVDDA